MKKKLLVVGLSMLMCFSLAACSFTSLRKNEPTTEEETVEGFESSDEVIEAYWQAFVDVKKSEFRDCFPDPDKAKKGETNIEDQIDDQYELAKAMEDSTEVDLDGIIIESENYDVDKVANNLDKAYDIEKAKISTVTVPLIQTVDEGTYHVNDIYEFVTVRIDGNWYISTINEIDVEIVDEPETTTPTTVEPIEETTETTTENTESTTTTNPNVGDPVSVNETDYSKVNWGVTYPIDGYEGITVSVTPYVDDYGTWYLVVGVTSLYEGQVTFSGSAEAKDANGNIIGDTFAYIDIGGGNTNIFTIRCDEGTTPNGEIHWEDIKINDSYKEYVPWAADWDISSNGDNELVLNYTITNASSASVGQVYGLLLDANGYVIDVFSDYVSDTGTTITDSDSIYRTDIIRSGAADVAFFANPTK